jgi:2,3-bisphosphoglycerate-independent phosphoglycerate mutase
LLSAAIKAAEAVDECVGKILNKVKSMCGAAIVTADHGNFEKMIDGSTLADIGPTLLEIMGLPQPEEMTG